MVDDIDGLAAQCRIQKKLKPLETEANVKSELNQFFSWLSQRRCRKKPVIEFEDKRIEEEEQVTSTQFLQTQKRQLIDLPDHLGR